MLLHLRQGSDALRGSKPSESLQFSAFESSGGSPPMQVAQCLEEPVIHDDGWFGQEESPSLLL